MIKLSEQRLRPPCKIHGGKYYLAPWVVENLPTNYESLAYVEPFAGMASVLLNKPRGQVEAVNDLDRGVVRILRALRDDVGKFVTRLRQVEYTEDTFSRAKQALPTDDDFEAALNEYVVRRMSRGGLMKAFGWSKRLRGGQPGDLNAWLTMLDMLPVIAERLRGVEIHNKPALSVIEMYDEPGALLYCDPPYLPNTRTSPKAYGVEMSENDHIALALALRQFKGKVALSGYPSALYDALYRDWRRIEKEIANHASQEEVKERKTEVLWINY